MAKKLSFGDKVGKQKNLVIKHIKLIRADRSKKSGALRFYEEMVCIPEGKNADSVVKDLLSKKA